MWTKRTSSRNIKLPSCTTVSRSWLDCSWINRNFFKFLVPIWQRSFGILSILRYKTRLLTNCNIWNTDSATFPTSKGKKYSSVSLDGFQHQLLRNFKNCCKLVFQSRPIYSGVSIAVWLLNFFPLMLTVICIFTAYWYFPFCFSWCFRCNDLVLFIYLFIYVLFSFCSHAVVLIYILHNRFVKITSFRCYFSAYRTLAPEMVYSRWRGFTGGPPTVDFEPGRHENVFRSHLISNYKPTF